MPNTKNNQTKKQLKDKILELEFENAQLKSRNHFLEEKLKEKETNL